MTLTTMLDLVRDKGQNMRLAAATWYDMKIICF